MWNPSRRIRRRFPLRQKLSALIWILSFGIASYGWIFYSMLDDVQQIYESMEERMTAHLHHPSNLPVDAQHSEIDTTSTEELPASSRKIQEESSSAVEASGKSGEEASPMETSQTVGKPTRMKEHITKVRERKVRNRANARASRETGDDSIDWTFWILCLCSGLLSLVRIRLEPERPSPSDRVPRRRNSTTAGHRTEHPIVRQSLRHINRVRQARGDPPLPLETFRQHRTALLHDPALWRALAGHGNVEDGPPPGASKEQLGACPEHIVEETDPPNDCCICLGAYEVGDVTRSLPCQHSFHKDCIDLWFQQSIVCPMCKTELPKAAAAVAETDTNAAANTGGE